MKQHLNPVHVLCAGEGDVGPHEYKFTDYCGAHVCFWCDHHKGLTRCYCGWSESGDDGRQELIDMGETIEED